MCDLLEKTDVCKIYNCVQYVEGIESNSASPTDTWIIQFKKNTKYDKENIEFGFFKIFLNSFTVSLLPKPYNNILPKINGLEYEILVYKNIIKPLINYNVCPNFVKYLASGNNCTYDDLFNMIYKKVDLSPEKIKECLNRNINCIKKDCKKRFAINKYVPKSYFRSDLTELYIDTSEIPKSYGFNIILNEILPKKSVTFDAWLVKSTNINDIWLILFQICVACYTMSLCKMTHNDLHLANIVLEEKRGMETITYVINDKKYTLYTNFKVYIFDFDRSFCQNLGPNNINLQTNIFIDNIDIIEIMCEISNYIKNPIINCKIANAICKNGNQANYINSNIIKNCNLRKNYSKYNSSIEILENISTYLPNIDGISKNIYVCNNKVFDDGFLSQSLQENIYKETIKILNKLPSGVLTNKLKPLLEYNIKLNKCFPFSEIEHEDEDVEDFFNIKSFFKSRDTYKKYLLKSKEELPLGLIADELSPLQFNINTPDISPVKNKRGQLSLVNSKASSLAKIPEYGSEESLIFPFEEDE